jgi:hypothetical protein
MDEDNATEKTPVKLIAETQPGGIYQTYANHYNLSWTAYDVQVRFSQYGRVPEFTSTDDHSVRLEQRAVITVSWPEAKALALALANAIQEFEKLNGEIQANPQPPS